MRAALNRRVRVPLLVLPGEPDRQLGEVLIDVGAIVGGAALLLAAVHGFVVLAWAVA